MLFLSFLVIVTVTFWMPPVIQEVQKKYGVGPVANLKYKGGFPQAHLENMGSACRCLLGSSAITFPENKDKKRFLYGFHGAR